MSKISIIPKPTFDAVVNISDNEGGFLPVKMTFRHKTRTELNDFVGNEMPYADAILEIVAGWEFSEELTRENVERLIDNRISAGNAIIDTYAEALVGARAKN